MRAVQIGLCGVVMVAIGGVMTSGQSQRVIRNQVFADRVVDWPLEAQMAEYKEMDSKKLTTVRIVEAGHISINARRIVGAETALIHGDRGDIWIVREGSGTLVTGGELVNAKGSATGDQSGTAIQGGVERVIKEGDMIFIPPGIPHGIKDSKAITWTNIHYAQTPGVWPHFDEIGGTDRVIRNFSPIDRAIDWPLEAQKAEYAWMDKKKVTGVRIVEGGLVSMNARRERGNPTFNLHEDEGDIWIVREGSGTMVTGGEIVGTGASRAFKGGTERPIKAGDIIYTPPRVVHGIKDSTGITWMNIHFHAR